MSFSLRVLFLGILTFLATSCGPVYRTEYKMVPPESAEGRACTFQCENGRLQCRQLEDMRVTNCEQQARIEEERCEARIWWTKGREPKWYECGSNYCSADYNKCDDIYRSCYQSCGGRVEPYTRCVSGCDQIPPASPVAGRYEPSPYGYQAPR